MEHVQVTYNTSMEHLQGIYNTSMGHPQVTYYTSMVHLQVTYNTSMGHLQIGNVRTAECRYYNDEHCAALKVILGNLAQPGPNLRSVDEPRRPTHRLGPSRPQCCVSRLISVDLLVTM